MLTIAALSLIALEASSQPSIQSAKDGSANIMTVQHDLANRSPEIHWPPRFDPLKAELFSHNELFINASCERVWQHIIEAPKWPQWYPNSKDVRIVSHSSSVLEDGTALMHRGHDLWLATLRWVAENKPNDFERRLYIA